MFRSPAVWEALVMLYALLGWLYTFLGWLAIANVTLVAADRLIHRSWVS